MERRVWRRTETGGGGGGSTGGLAATISLMLVRPVAAATILYRTRAHTRPISENGNGKLFKHHVYRHVPSRTYGHARVCAPVTRVHISVYVCVVCVWDRIPSSFRPNTDPIHVSRDTRLPSTAAAFGKRWLCASVIIVSVPIIIGACDESRIFDAGSPISMSLYASRMPNSQREREKSGNF